MPWFKRSTRYFDQFEAAAATLLESARALRQLVKQPLESEHVARRITELEREADGIGHETIRMLHQTFAPPFDRREIHRLVTCLDDVVDGVEEAADCMLLYEIAAPPAEISALADLIGRGSEMLQEAIAALRTLGDPRALLDMCAGIGRLESEGDAVYRRGLTQLFQDGRDPIEVVKLQHLFEILENAIDSCEDVANVIEGIVLEHG